LVRALRGEALDHPPVWFMRQAGRYLPEYRELRGRARNFLDLCYTPDFAVEVSLQPLRRFDLDAVILFADILLVPDALGQSVRFVEGEGPRLDPIRSRSDVARLDVGRLDEHLAPVYETVRRLAAELEGPTALIGFAGAPWTVATYMVEGRGGADALAAKRWAYADDEGFSALIDVLTDVTVRYLVAQADAGADVVQVFDTWAGMLPEQGFRRWCLEPLTIIARRFRAVHPEVPLIAFPRGTATRLPALIEETGVDGIGIDTTVSPVWAARILQPHCTVQGNLDPGALMAGGAAMKREAVHILKSLSGGRFVFNLGHGILPDTPPEHVAELVALVRNWRTGAAVQNP
jgi:uroporphyrinogen decarboxylase